MRRGEERHLTCSGPNKASRHSSQYTGWLSLPWPMNSMRRLIIPGTEQRINTNRYLNTWGCIPLGAYERGGAGFEEARREKVRKGLINMS